MVLVGLLIGWTTRASTITQRQTSWGLRILGQGTISRAGDVNEDGLMDISITKNARGWVVFGGSKPGTIDLNDLDESGFVIEGPAGTHLRAESAGDVNADGYGDMIFGAPELDREGSKDAGGAFVVFGGPTGRTIRLDDFLSGMHGDTGFVIRGGPDGFYVGMDVDGTGDVNQDGHDDLAVAAPWSGTVYVVFGKESGSEVDLGLFDLGVQGPQGYSIETKIPVTTGDYSISGVGDMNGDGRGDLVVGLSTGLHTRGSVSVVLGKADSLPVDARKMGTWGFRIDGAQRNDTFGYDTDAAGDVNGDGLSDVVIGAPRLPARDGMGYAAIIFGKTDLQPVNAAQLGTNGYRLHGPKRGGAGYSVSGTGDVDGDGLSDVVIGAPKTGRGSLRFSGSVFVVLGKRTPRDLLLTDLRGHGYRIRGSHGDQYLGLPVAGLGDVNGDGAADVGADIVDRAFVFWDHPSLDY